MYYDIRFVYFDTVNLLRRQNRKRVRETKCPTMALGFNSHLVGNRRR